MLFKAQIAFNNTDGQRRKCTLVLQADGHDQAPAEVSQIARAYFSAAAGSVEVLSLDAVTGGFTVLGRWPH